MNLHKNIQLVRGKVALKKKGSDIASFCAYFKVCHFIWWRSEHLWMIDLHQGDVIPCCLQRMQEKKAQSATKQLQNHCISTEIVFSVPSYTSLA